MHFLVSCHKYYKETFFSISFCNIGAERLTGLRQEPVAGAVVNNNELFSSINAGNLLISRATVRFSRITLLSGVGLFTGREWASYHDLGFEKVSQWNHNLIQPNSYPHNIFLTTVLIKRVVFWPVTVCSSNYTALQDRRPFPLYSLLLESPV
jgi:hypothetical protein